MEYTKKLEVLLREPFNFIYKELEKKGICADEYVVCMRLAGVRLCNDGWPDARHKETYADAWTSVRYEVSVARRLYAQELSILTKMSEVEHSHIGKSFLGFLRSM